jgi:hypothetical protein
LQLDEPERLSEGHPIVHAHLRPGLAKLWAAPGRGAHPAQNSGAPPPRHLGPRGALGSAAGPAGTGYGPINASPLVRQSWDRTRRSPPPRRRPPPSTPCALADPPAPLGPRERALFSRLHRRGGEVPPNFGNGHPLRPLISTPAKMSRASGIYAPRACRRSLRIRQLLSYPLSSFTGPARELCVANARVCARLRVRMSRVSDPRYTWEIYCWVAPSLVGLR